MREIRELLTRRLTKEFVSAVLSNPKDKQGVTKVKVRPVLVRGEMYFQCESFRNNQAFHENLTAEQAVDKLTECMQNLKQMQLETRETSAIILVSKKGKVTIKEKKSACSCKEVSLSHNKEKEYILKEGMIVPFLQDLGVMTQEGKIVRSKFDKFRQINRFLEFVEDILPRIEKKEEITILDFGCGKSYLTFAIYYYLHELKGLDVKIIGLDLKSDVIRRCNELSQKYGYEKLEFLEGNIADYKGVNQVDMVVTLHACDTATDYALAKAVEWKATVILSVPCCQHEINGQIKNDFLSPILGYGLIRERMAALITDAMRGQYLEEEGYDTQILEFIDMEHTPKNILIRAVKNGKPRQERKEVKACEEFLHISPTLSRLLKERGNA